MVGNSKRVSRISSAISSITASVLKSSVLDPCPADLVIMIVSVRFYPSSFQNGWTLDGLLPFTMKSVSGVKRQVLVGNANRPSFYWFSETDKLEARRAGNRLIKLLLSSAYKHYT